MNKNTAVYEHIYVNISTHRHISIIFVHITHFISSFVYIYILYNIYIIHTIFSPQKKWRSVSQFACTLCPLLKGALFLSPARRRHKCQCLDLWVDLRLRHRGPKRPKRRVGNDGWNPKFSPNYPLVGS